jgi:hypothetical protein
MSEEEEEEQKEQELPQTNAEPNKEAEQKEQEQPQTNAELNKEAEQKEQELPKTIAGQVKEAEQDVTKRFLSWLDRNGLKVGRPVLLIVVVFLSLLLLLFWIFRPAIGDALFKDFINLIGIFISWPVVVLIALLLLYKPLSGFLESLGKNNQNVKVSILQFFALEVSKASEFTPTWSVPGVDLKFGTGNEISRSGMPSLFQQFQGNQSIDYAIFDIGDGKQWLTSRLFIFAIMLERMRGLRCLVFVESTPDVGKRFLGTASPNEIRWKLAKLQHWLEPAFAKASGLTQYVQGWSLRASNPAVPALKLPPKPLSPHYILSVYGGVEAADAEEVVRAFLNDPNIQQNVKPPTELDDGNWEEITPQGKSSFWEHAHWIDRAWIQNLDLKHGSDAFLTYSPDDSQVKQTQAILKRKGTFIALVDENNEFKELIDRQTLLENVIKNLNELPDAKQ